MTETVNIPEHHQAFCRAVAQVAKAHGLQKFSGTFRPGWKGGWQGDISFSWEQGRHGEDAGQIDIRSQFYVRTKIFD